MDTPKLPNEIIMRIILESTTSVNKEISENKAKFAKVIDDLRDPWGDGASQADNQGWGDFTEEFWRDWDYSTNGECEGLSISMLKLFRRSGPEFGEPRVGYRYGIGCNIPNNGFWHDFRHLDEELAE
jgi:hypothetical protein